jgi:hypothetical protein
MLHPQVPGISKPQYKLTKMQVEEIATEKHTIKLNCDLHFLVFIKKTGLLQFSKKT